MLKAIFPYSILFLCLVPFGGVEYVGSAEGSLFRQVGWGAVFLLALLQSIREDNRFSFPWLWIPIPYFVLLIYALVSVAWSEVPLVSARRAAQLIGVLLIALALVRLEKFNNPFANFAWPGLVFLIIGAVALVDPSISVDLEGNYKGFTFTKNVWAQFAMLMSLIFMFISLSNLRSRLNWIFFLLASMSLIATRSATSIIIYLIANFILLYFIVLKRFKRVFFLILSVGVLLSLFALFLYFIVEGELLISTIFDNSMNYMGKDSTLTGRTALWQWMIYEIAHHPWFGAGYGGFWMGLDGPSSTIFSFFKWRPGQAHSGYLDVINELGYVGLGLLFVLLVSHLWNIFRMHRRGECLTSIFHLAILVAALLLNVSETNFMRTTHLWWIVLTASIIWLHVQFLKLNNSQLRIVYEFFR